MLWTPVCGQYADCCSVSVRVGCVQVWIEAGKGGRVRPVDVDV